MSILQTNLNKVREHVANKLGNPAVYVGTYHKYNCGSLFGAWLDLLTFETYQEFIQTCKTLHGDEEDPELMFQDFDFCIRKDPRSEWFDDEDFEMTQEAFDRYGDDMEKYDAYREWLEDFEGGYPEEFEYRLAGKFDSDEDFAEDYIENGDYNIPDWLDGCIDWTQVWYKLFNDYYQSYNGFYVYVGR